MANLTAAIPQLTQVPQCALPAYEAIAAAGCGPSLACICGNDNFFLTLQGAIFTGSCTPVEVQESVASSQSICAEAAPWLNDNRGPEVVAAITILTVMSTIAVVLRILSRRVSTLKFGADDWLIGLALVFSYGLTITQYVAVHYGFGKHMLMLNPEEIIPFTKTFFISPLLFVVTAAAVKISVLFFYQRIFPAKRFRTISIIIGIVVIAWFIAHIFIVFFICIPLAYWWDKSIPGGHCINANDTAYYGTSPPDILTNIAILILPLPYLWDLQMQRAKKLAITIIFLLGSFATVGSIVRVPLLVGLKATDVSWSIVNSGIWLNVECNIGILSASLPVLRPLFSKSFSSAIRSRFSKSRSSRYGAGSQRLPDAEKGMRSSTLVNKSAHGDVYQGGGKSHRTWYNAAVSAIGSKNDELGSEGSLEEMVPVGRIAVRHDVDWEAKDSGVPATPPGSHVVDDVREHCALR